MNYPRFKFVLTLSADLALFVVAALNFIVLVEKPDLPILTKPDLTIIHDKFSEKTGFIADGDRLISINGLRIYELDDIEFICDGLSIGDIVKIETGNQVYMTSGYLMLIPYYSDYYNIIVIFVWLVFFIPGVYIFIKKPGDSASRMFHWLSVTCGLISIMTWGKYNLYPFIISFFFRFMLDASHLVMAALFIHFTLIFPYRRENILRHRYLLPAVYLSVIAVLIFLGIWQYKALASDNYMAYGDYDNHRDILMYAMFITLVFLGIASTINAYRSAMYISEKKKLRWLLFGIASGPSGYIFLWVIPIMITGRPFIPEGLMILLTTVAPITFFISIVRYRYFDIDVVIKRSTVYALAIAAVMILYAGIVSFIMRIISLFSFHESQEAASAIAAVIVALLFQPAKRRTQAYIDKKFFRVSYNSNKVKDDFLAKVKETISLQELAGIALNSVEKIIPSNGSAIIVFHPEEENDSGVYFCNNLELSEYNINVLKKTDFREFPALPLALPESVEEGSDFYSCRSRILEQTGAAIMVYCIYEGYVSVIIMRNKKSGFRYSAEDLDIIKYILQESAMAMRKIMLQQNLILQQAETQKLAELNKTKSYFVSSVSHELKTPLTSVRLFAELLQMQTSIPPEKKFEYLEIIINECDRLNRLINNVLDFSKIERGVKQYKFMELCLNKAIDLTLFSFRHQLHFNNFHLDISLGRGDYIILADPDAVAEALINLISNAMKYSLERKYIAVRSFENGNSYAVSVEDKGIGIPENDQKHIFDSFYRSSEAGAQSVGGTGLGLALVHNIMQAHNGRIEVKSKPGQGSTFTLYFPKRSIL